MSKIKNMDSSHIVQAKRLIVTVADSIYQWNRPIDETLWLFDEQNVFQDMCDVQAYYFDCHGVFLALFDDDQLIGTGAFRKIDETVCELKRMYLLPQYHGQGIGYRVIQKLLDQARQLGYKTIRLETGEQHSRAIRFYERLGFHHVVPFGDGADHHVFMEMAL